MGFTRCWGCRLIIKDDEPEGLCWSCRGEVSDGAALIASASEDAPASELVIVPLCPAGAYPASESLDDPAGDLYGPLFRRAH